MALKRKTKKLDEKKRLESELKDIILNNIKGKVDAMLDSDKTFSKYLKKLQEKKIDPFEAADKISKLVIK